MMNRTEKRALEISGALKEWFKEECRNETTPEEIMPYLYEKGIYNEGKRKDALKLRADLRKLFEENSLDLIEGVRFIQKNKNKEWYFVKV